MYVKNADLRNEIIKSKAQDKLTDEALAMLILMSNRFTYKLSYMDENDRQDCIAQAIMDCYCYWRAYDPEKGSNAFAYFTQVIKNGMGKSWRAIEGGYPKSIKVSISNNTIYNF